MTDVIALLGPAGSGKSTVADHLIAKYGAVRYSLAGPLKKMVGDALNFSYEQLYGTQEQKEAPDPRYGGKSARWFLQRIGTEGVRNNFGQDFWTKRCIEQIILDAPALAVIDDMRFINEAQLLQFWPALDFRGYVWRLMPPDDETTLERHRAAGTHQSECEWALADADIEIAPKKRGIPELLALVDEAMTALKASK